MLDEFNLSGKAIRKVKEYKDLPNKGGFRYLILQDKGYSGTKNDGFCRAMNDNLFSHSRIYKKEKIEKTAGRSPAWSEFVKLRAEDM